MSKKVIEHRIKQAEKELDSLLDKYTRPGLPNSSQYLKEKVIKYVNRLFWVDSMSFAGLHRISYLCKLQWKRSDTATTKQAQELVIIAKEETNNFQIPLEHFLFPEDADPEIALGPIFKVESLEFIKEISNKQGFFYILKNGLRNNLHDALNRNDEPVLYWTIELIIQYVEEIEERISFQGEAEKDRFPQITEKERKKTDCYRLYDSMMKTENPLKSEAKIKQAIADELHITVRTVRNYLQERKK